MAKILLVEDNEMNRDMLSRRLIRKGYQVVVSEDGAKGVAMGASEHPDIILMDMSLPVIDGWDATRMLKQAPETAAVPIIALTAHAMAGDRDKALEAGCDDYDTKPIELPRLLQKIQRLLEHSGRFPAVDDRRGQPGRISAGIRLFAWRRSGRRSPGALCPSP